MVLSRRSFLGAVAALIAAPAVVVTAKPLIKVDTFRSAPYVYPQLEESIRRIGIVNPLVVENQTLVCGVLRLEAARRIGLTHVPTIEWRDGKVYHGMLPVTDFEEVCK